MEYVLLDFTVFAKLLQYRFERRNRNLSLEITSFKASFSIDLSFVDQQLRISYYNVTHMY